MKKILLLTAVSMYACLPLKRYLQDDLTCTFQSVLLNNMETFDIDFFKKNVRYPGGDVFTVKDDENEMIELFAASDSSQYIRVQINKQTNIATWYIYEPVEGKLKERYYTYDKGDVEIGEHLWYGYRLNGIQLERYVEKTLNYDTLYPICWKEAIHIAVKHGIPRDDAYLESPWFSAEDPPRERGRAFWHVNRESAAGRFKDIRIDAYTGEVKVSYINVVE